ncbi:hypothetical protein V1514DRAFT_331945 [Lipomyces japonicus]|uniref:uncharacterized protein n=1 Tax=Lipomyces japonicus TaxID=56871 RepID=UPI0034CEA952
MPSLFLAVYVAIYSYAAQSAQELSLAEGDVLYILEKPADDDWWKAKKRVVGAEADEPVGLIPNNYVEPMQVAGKAKALYDYDQQTDEEVSFKERDILDVYDTSDPDWVLVGVREEFGFAPSNYIEYLSEEAVAAHLENIAAGAPPAQSQYAPPADIPAQVEYEHEDQYSESPVQPERRPSYSGNRYSGSREPEYHHNDNYEDDEDDEDDEAPTLPSRPRASSQTSDVSANSKNAVFLRWKVQEVDNRKKYKATLAIGNGSILFSPERADASPQQWSISNLINYNHEKKHVFLDFEHPSTSLDLHAGSKETASEIISAIGELVGAHKASGLREVIEASVPSGQKYGKVLYDFDAQGDDEVTVREGDDVFIIDNQKSDEWWMIRHAVSGKEGVVPSSYIEVIKKPIRSSSLVPKEDRDRPKRSSKSRREESPPPSLPSKPKPDPNNIRTWTDRTGTFKVEAALVGVSDGKIQLHKVNGVKIAVAVNKMSHEDLAYVERVTNIALDEELQKPKAKNSIVEVNHNHTHSTSARPEFDWFEFFLGCGVDVNNCQRYATNFQKDQMDEAVLPDITSSVMRMLGLKEGDILRVSKVIDDRYKSKRSVSFADSSLTDNQDGEESIFLGPGGTLKNNTRKSRPAPAISTPASVDGKLLSSGKSEERNEQRRSSPIKESAVPASTPLSGALKELVEFQPLQPVSAPVSEPKVQQATIVHSQQTGPVQQTPPVLSPNFTGQQAQNTGQYATIQPRLVIAHQGVTQLPTGIQSQPQQFSDQVQYAQPTGVSVSQSQQFFGIQRPTPPPTQLQPAATGVTFPPPPQNASASGTGFSAQASGFQSQLPQQHQPPHAIGIQGQPTGFQQFPLQQQLQPQPQIQQQPLNTRFFTQPTGFQQQPPLNGFQSIQPLQAQPTRSFVPQSQFGIQQMQTGFQGNVGFQPTGGGPIGNSSFSNSSVLQAQPTGFGFGNGQTINASGGAPRFNGSNGGVNATLMKPLLPTKTGPPPNVSFGINKSLERTPTGNRTANLAAATPENPFGF